MQNEDSSVKKVLTILTIVIIGMFLFSCDGDIMEALFERKPKKILVSIEVTTNTDIFLEGDNIKDYITVQSIYSDGTRKVVSNYTVSPTDITSATNTITVYYEENGVAKSQDISITVKDKSSYTIGNNWFSTFSGTDKKDITSISFVKEKPTNVIDSDKVGTIGNINCYKKDNDIYVVADRTIIFSSDCQGMFRSFENVEKIDLSNVDTSNVTNMNSMFYVCDALQSLDLRNFNTSKVSDMASMFGHCHNLKSLDISSFDTSNVTDMGGMFWSCLVLPSLDISNFNTPNVKDAYGMFMYCEKLESINLGIFNPTSATDLRYMFGYCKQLKTIDLRGFHISESANMGAMFMECGNSETKVIINPIYKTSFDETELGNSSAWVYSESSSTYTCTNKIGPDWFDYFTGMEKTDISSISFINDKPTDVTDKVGNIEDLCCYKKNSNIYIIGEKIIFEADCSNMFWFFQNVERIDLSGVADTSNVDLMEGMFNGCFRLTTVIIRPTAVNETKFGNQLMGWNYTSTTDFGTYTRL